MLRYAPLSTSSNDLFADYRHDVGLEFCCPVGRDGPRGAFYVYGFTYVFGRTLFDAVFVFYP